MKMTIIILYSIVLNAINIPKCLGHQRFPELLERQGLLGVHVALPFSIPTLKKQRRIAVLIAKAEGFRRLQY